MARGEKKDTIGTKVESWIKGAGALAGAGTGAAAGLELSSMAPAEGPESLAAKALGVGSIFAGGYMGVKAARKADGLGEKIDAIKPERMQSGEIYLDEEDPFDIGLQRSDVNRLEENQKQTVMDELGEKQVNEHNLARYARNQVEEQDNVDEWVEEVYENTFGEIKGLEGEFTTSVHLSGDYKHGYVDRKEEVFVQAPKKGDTFDEALRRVETWSNNKDTLNSAEQYIDDVLSNEGQKTVEEGAKTVEIDYEFLRENEEILREEVEGGIMTPSEEYEIVITSHEGEPLPVLVGEYNPDMEEHGSREADNYEEIEKRKQVLGMYMDGLIEEGVFDANFGDYWKSEGHGREKTKNMFYDEETDTVGLTDIGEYTGRETVNTSQVDVARS